MADLEQELLRMKKERIALYKKRLRQLDQLKAISGTMVLLGITHLIIALVYGLAWYLGRIGWP
jgi:hypothetical protein